MSTITLIPRVYSPGSKTQSLLSLISSKEAWEAFVYVCRQHYRYLRRGRENMKMNNKLKLNIFSFLSSKTFLWTSKLPAPLSFCCSQILSFFLCSLLHHNSYFFLIYRSLMNCSLFPQLIYLFF